MKRLIHIYYEIDAGYLWLGVAICIPLGLLAFLLHGSFPLMLLMSNLLNQVGPGRLSKFIRRGLPRIVWVLPVDAAEFGRAWWLASVGIPAICSAGVFVFGAAFADLCGSHSGWRRAGEDAGLILLCLGAAFPLFLWHGHANLKSWARSIWSNPFGVLCGGLIGLASAALLYRLRYSTTVSILCGLGAALTAIGWFCAGEIVKSLACSRRGTARSKEINARPPRELGYGGTPRFLSVTLTRVLLIGLGIAALFAAAGNNSSRSWSERFESGSPVGILFAVIFLLMMLAAALLPQLRVLRTLPISTRKLAALLLGTAILPIAVMAVVTVAAGGWLSGMPAAVIDLDYFLLAAAFAALGISLGVWSGEKYAAVLPGVIGLIPVVLLSFACDLSETPFVVATAGVSIFCVALSFRWTRRDLVQRGSIYRARAAIESGDDWDWSEE
jgi:hypothetical protein